MNLSKYLSLIKRFIPESVIEKLKPFLFMFRFNYMKERRRIRLLQKNYKKLVEKAKEKDKIKVAFLVINAGIWKCDQLYSLMECHPDYEPTLFVCPFTTYTKEIMEQEMYTIYSDFSRRGYRVVNTLKEDNTWLDIKSEYQPDLVFFLTPWKLTRSEYLIDNFLDTLSCYIIYGYAISDHYQFHYNLDLQNYCWTYFLESSYHSDFAKEYSIAKGENTFVTGYPSVDIFLDTSYSPQNVWKKTEKPKKKIIWAPHHSIPHKTSSSDFSTFLTYAELMLELVKKYEGQVQFAFKPHPNLRGKLYEVWGKNKTDEFYESWKSSTNGQLEEGSYVDLFLTSDAMIHDSASFMVEYLFVNKPVMYLINKDIKNTLNQLNPVGAMALHASYHGYNKEDIIGFIENTVLKDSDKMFDVRKRLFQELSPPNNRSASENILDYLNQKLRE